MSSSKLRKEIINHCCLIHSSYKHDRIAVEDHLTDYLQLETCHVRDYSNTLVTNGALSHGVAYQNDEGILQGKPHFKSLL